MSDVPREITASKPTLFDLETPHRPARDDPESGVATGDGKWPRGSTAAGKQHIPQWAENGGEGDGIRSYQTRQAFSRTIGCPFLHPKAFWNSGILETTPLTRAVGVE